MGLAKQSLSYIHVSGENTRWEDTSFLTPEVSITGVARSVASCR